MRAWIFVGSLIHPPVLRTVADIYEIINMCWSNAWDSLGGSLAWPSSRNCNVAAGIPWRHSGVEWEPGRCSWSRDWFPFFLPLVWLSPVHFNLRAFLLMSPISDTASHEDRTCLILFAFSPLYLLPFPSFFSFQDPWPVPASSWGEVGMRLRLPQVWWDGIMCSEQTEPDS